jgi:predicted sugar kinase
LYGKTLLDSIRIEEQGNIMSVEITTPACLLLGLVQHEGQPCQLGVTLRYPPLQLLARAAPTLMVTGGRADLAYRQAERFYAYQRTAVPPRSPARESELPLSPAWERGAGGEGAEIEIELAIPTFMGLGSSALLGLSVARSLAMLHGRPADDAQELARAVGLPADEALETHAFAQGGLLLVDGAGALRRRQPVATHDEAGDWVFVLVLPRVPPGTPETLEADRRLALRQATARRDPETGRIFSTILWPAVVNDDIEEFARGLMAIQALNYAALLYTSEPMITSDEEAAILHLMRAGGALAWGRCICGMGLYGLIKGGGPSRDLRRALTERLGYFGGMVMATLCDNEGAQGRVVGS